MFNGLSMLGSPNRLWIDSKMFLTSYSTGGPLILEAVQADVALGVYVGVVAGHEDFFFNNCFRARCGSISL